MTTNAGRRLSNVRGNVVAAITALLLGAPAAAQQPASAAGEAEPTRRYRVEFIVFAHADASTGNEQLEAAASAGARAPAGVERRRPFGVEPGRGEFGEPVFSDRPGGPDESGSAAGADTSRDPGGEPARDTQRIPDPGTNTDAGSDTDTDTGPAADPRIELFGPPAFRSRPYERSFEPLPADALTLTDTRRRLERLGAYRVIAHAGWEQDELSEQQARPLDLAELGIGNPSGTLTLFVSRYLHVIVNLRLRDTDAQAARVPGAAGGAVSQQGLTRIRTLPSYVLETQRRITRTGELHYIDHPLFGVLVTITEAPEPERDEPESAGGELDPAA